jgi:hypothetical protein
LNCLSRVLLIGLAGVAFASCESDPQIHPPQSAFAQAASLIASQQPKAVFSNENHEDDVTRYLSACWLDVLSQDLRFTALAAETFHFDEPIDPNPYAIDRLNGYYIFNHHFDDLFHVAGANELSLVAYDSFDQPLVSVLDLEAAGFEPSSWNIRDRTAAMNLLTWVAQTDTVGPIFVHTGPGHILRANISRPNGFTTGVAGHLQDLSGITALSIDNATSELSDFWADRFFPCPALVDFEAFSIVVEFQANRLHCIDKSDFKPHRRVYDVSVVDRPALGDNGFVEPTGQCGHRLIIKLPVPNMTELSNTETVRLSIMQTDGMGRYVSTWRQTLADLGQAEVTAYPFATGESTLIWEIIPGRDGQDSSVIENIEF